MTMILPFLLAVSSPPAGCLAIDAQSVFARDVAAAVPAFAQVPGDFLLGFLAGAPRVFKGADLERLAKNQGVELTGLPDVCFTRRTFVPQPDQIREAILKALAESKIDAKIEIVASSSQSAPSGELVFPRSGIQLPIAPEVLWHGYVRYGENGKFPVWARVRVTAVMARVVAVTRIQPGKPVQKSQVILESCEDSPLDDTVARNLDEVIGYVPKVSLAAAAPIHKTTLEPPTDVTRGDMVRVDVRAGGAHLMLEALAQSSGVTGSTVTVRNLSSGKDFHAEVTGKGQVAVQ
jgi:flagella basal body P-ring formation protein FlgA